MDRKWRLRAHTTNSRSLVAKKRDRITAKRRKQNLIFFFFPVNRGEPKCVQRVFSHKVLSCLVIFLCPCHFVNLLWNTMPSFPMVYESACNAGNAVSIPGLGRSPAGGNGYPLQYS